MAQSSRSFRNLAASVFVLSCLGGVWWLLLPEGTEDPVAAVVQMAEDLAERGGGERNGVAEAGRPERAKRSGSEEAGTAGPSELSGTVEAPGASSEAGTREAQKAPVPSGSLAGGKEAAERTEESGSPQEVSGALGEGGVPAAVDPGAELLARVENAMRQSGTTMPGGDSVSGAVENRPPEQGEKRQDSVVTAGFARDMGSWLASGYVPPRREGEKGHTSRTLVNANFRYSTSGTLRTAERDPLKGRAGILNYVFSSGMMEALYRMYSPSLLEEMERAARDEKRRVPLEDVHVADMFMVYADAFRRLGVSLEAASGADLASLSAAVHREAAQEAAANDDFARAYTALSQAREHGRRDEVAVQSRRMAESTRIAGLYAERQERAKNDMVHAIRSRASESTLSSAELLFLGEWLSRRRASAETVRSAADICLRTAELMRQRAERILHPESAPVEEPAPAQEGAASAASAAKDAGTASPAASSVRSRISFADRSSSGTEAYGRLVKDDEPSAKAAESPAEVAIPAASVSPASSSASESSAAPAEASAASSSSAQVPLPAASETAAPASSEDSAASVSLPASGALVSETEVPVEASAVAASSAPAPAGASASPAESSASSVPAEVAIPAASGSPADSSASESPGAPAAPAEASAASPSSAQVPSPDVK